MRRRRLLLTLVIAAGVLLAWPCWRCVAFLHWFAYPTPENRQPRPMFHEWRAHDWGYGWGMCYTYSDEHAVWATADKTLNILVIVATGDPGARSGLRDGGIEHTTLWLWTPFETTVPRTENLLVWTDRGGTHRLHLVAGVATEVYEALGNEPSATGEPSDILQTVLKLYRGDDVEELTSLVAAYRRALMSPTTQQAPTTQKTANP